mmetsp:Transcript_7501/g.22765  ORF Transcript_7501/g.22765 Transcript_7501/m.22765 type:complete len:90 (-) Transcript_7501:231-500(-)
MFEADWALWLSLRQRCRPCVNFVVLERQEPSSQRPDKVRQSLTRPSPFTVTATAAEEFCDKLNKLGVNALVLCEKFVQTNKLRGRKPTS